MSNVFTELNVGSGGSVMDETGIAYPSSPVLRRRTRIVLAGDGIDELVKVSNTELDGDEYGLVTRSLQAFPANSITNYNAQPTVAYNTETTICSYTVPAGANFYFTGLVTHGDVPSVFRVYVGATCKLSFRSVSSNPTVQQNFNTPCFKATSAAVVTIKAIHYMNGTTGDYEATILGYTV